MSVRRYLPSAQFGTIVGSIGLAGVLILGAQYVTRPPGPSQLAAAPESPTTQDWQSSLEAIEANAPGLPQAPSQESMVQLLDAAKSSTVTATVARSLLVNLSGASAQGLGSDIPTQDSLVRQAVSQLKPAKPNHIYTAADLKTSGTSAAEMRAYGNKVMEVMGRHTDATSGATLRAVSKATDAGSAAELGVLPHIQEEYAALADDLAQVPVPTTLVPLHLQAVNDIAAAAASFDDLRHVIDDPLRGLGGLQQYEQMLGETGRVLTSVADSFAKNGILFTKDEPGSAWSVFLSS